MDLGNILRLANNFIHTHTLIAIGIVIGIIIIAWLKPKETSKFLLVILGLLVVGYILYYLVGATKSGISGKEHMINR
jgi:hypothetical protein